MGTPETTKPVDDKLTDPTATKAEKLHAKAEKLHTTVDRISAKAKVQAESLERLAARLESARAALGVLDDGLSGRDFLVGGYTVADVSLYAYAHVAGDAGIDMSAYPAVVAWLRRVEATPRFVNDLEPYPASASAGAGGPSVHG